MDGWGLKPQLLSETSSSVSELILNNKYSMSQKIDGRRLILKTGLNINGWSRSGGTTDIPVEVMDSFKKVSPDWIFDGEIVKNKYNVFDILEYSGVPISSKSWLERQNILNHVLQDFSEYVRIVPQFFGDEKNQHFENCMEIRAEGVVFCDIESRYYFGIRSKKSIKYKFVKTIDCVVIDKSINGKDNLLLGLYDSKENIVEVGKVSALTGDGKTIDFNVNDVITVKYLYGTNSNRLYQPVSPTLRKDKEPYECLMNQMIMKSETIL